MSKKIKVEELATLLANQRAGRKGVPPIDNVLDFLPSHLKKEVLDDATEILEKYNICIKET